MSDPVTVDAGLMALVNDVYPVALRRALRDAIYAALQAAEERGAERMRERAGKRLDKLKDVHEGDGECWDMALSRAARVVRALPTDKET